MSIERTEGIVLKTHALGDTSRIVVAYTRDFGLVRLVAKGARKTPSRFGFALEPLSRSRLVFYLKPNRDLNLLSQAEIIDPAGSKLLDLTRLAHASAKLELMDRLVWGEEPHQELYDLLRSAIEATIECPLENLAASTIAFELKVASLLGYRPRLDSCAGCGEAVSKRRLFSPARGGLVCDRCAASEAGAITVSADALAGLSLLLTRPVAEAGQFLELRRAGEILRVIEAFLRQHFQRFQGLKSLELLRSMDPPRASRANGAIARAAPCPN